MWALLLPHSWPKVLNGSKQLTLAGPWLTFSILTSFIQAISRHLTKQPCGQSYELCRNFPWWRCQVMDISDEDDAGPWKEGEKKAGEFEEFELGRDVSQCFTNWIVIASIKPSNVRNIWLRAMPKSLLVLELADRFQTSVGKVDNMKIFPLTSDTTAVGVPANSMDRLKVSKIVFIGKALLSWPVLQVRSWVLLHKDSVRICK